LRQKIIYAHARVQPIIGGSGKVRRDNNFSDDEDLVAYFMLDGWGGRNVEDCEINGAGWLQQAPSNITDVVSTLGDEWTDEFRQGLGAGDFVSADKRCMRRANNTLPTGFPGYDTQNLLICGWVKLDSIAGSDIIIIEKRKKKVMHI